MCKMFPKHLLTFFFLKTGNAVLLLDSILLPELSFKITKVSDSLTFSSSSSWSVSSYSSYSCTWPCLSEFFLSRVSAKVPIFLFLTSILNFNAYRNNLKERHSYTFTGKFAFVIVIEKYFIIFSHTSQQ